MELYLMRDKVRYIPSSGGREIDLRGRSAQLLRVLVHGEGSAIRQDDLQEWLSERTGTISRAALRQMFSRLRKSFEEGPDRDRLQRTSWGRETYAADLSGTYSFDTDGVLIDQQVVLEICSQATVDSIKTLETLPGEYHLNLPQLQRATDLWRANPYAEPCLGRAAPSAFQEYEFLHAGLLFALANAHVAEYQRTGHEDHLKEALTVLLSIPEQHPDYLLLAKRIVATLPDTRAAENENERISRAIEGLAQRHRDLLEDLFLRLDDEGWQIPVAEDVGCTRGHGIEKPPAPRTDRAAVTDGTRPADSSLRAVEEYLHQTVEEILAELPELPSGPSSDSFAQRVAERCCYVAPSFRAERITSPGAGRAAIETVEADPVEAILDSLRAHESAIIKGEPGTGKSLAAFMCFARLADAHIADSSNPLPMLIRLNALRSGPQDGDGTADPGPTGLCPAELRTCFDDSAFEDYVRSTGVVFILDGLDEMPATSRGPEDEQQALETIYQYLKYPSLMTVRTQYYQVYVDSHPIRRQFTKEYEIAPLEFATHVGPYVSRFCETRGRVDIIPKIIAAIRKNPSLKEVCTRALMLRMTTSVLVEKFASSGDIQDDLVFTGSGFVNAEVYETYITEWIRRDHEKEMTTAAGITPPLAWQEKIDLIQAIAFAIYGHSAEAEVPFTNFELADLLIDCNELWSVIETWLEAQPPRRAPRDAARILEDIQNRTFLIANHGRQDYRFVHKSFYEYLLARHVVAVLAQQDCSAEQAQDVLDRPFPDEVIDFIRELLLWAQSSRQDEFCQRFLRARIVRSLSKVGGGAASAPAGGAEPPHLMAVQQAVNLLPIIAEMAQLDRLAQTMSDPAVNAHPFVRRGLAVGIALHHDDQTLLDRFVEEMDVSDEARSYHIGYNRIYYGDQAYIAGVHRDDGTPQCEHFLAACLRHIRLDRYARLKNMALATVHYFLNDAGRRDYLKTRFPGMLDEVRAAAELVLESRHHATALRARAVLGDLDRQEA